MIQGTAVQSGVGMSPELQNAGRRRQVYREADLSYSPVPAQRMDCLSPAMKRVIVSILCRLSLGVHPRSPLAPSTYRS